MCVSTGCAPPLMDRILDTRLWKHYLSAATAADGNNRTEEHSNVVVREKT